MCAVSGSGGAKGGEDDGDDGGDEDPWQLEENTEMAPRMRTGSSPT